MFMNSAATTEISALSLHDALPILHEKAVAAVDHFIAGTGIAAGEELDELVGAGAADDARSVESVAPRQRLAQLDRAAIGITVELAGNRAIGGHRAWARAKRALVRGKPDEPVDALDLGLAADIGSDVEDARTRLRRSDHGDAAPSAVAGNGLA